MISRKIHNNDNRDSVEIINFYSHLGRIATIVPMALPHCAVEDMEIAGYHVPKNAIVNISLCICLILSGSV